MAVEAGEREDEGVAQQPAEARADHPETEKISGGYGQVGVEH